MYKNKKEIEREFNELELTEFGDFQIKESLTNKYEIIDFHCHLYDAVQSFLPTVFRKPLNNFDSSFFDLSCYPLSTKYFNMDRVLFTDYPSGKLGLLKTGFELSGLGGFINAMRSARPDRLKRDMKLNGISKAVVLQLNTTELDCMKEMEKVIKNNKELLTFGSIHPLDTEAEKKIKLNIASGVSGWKIAPHINGDNIDSNNSMRLLKLLHETDMPIITCSGLAFPKERLDIVPKSLRKSIETQNIKRFNFVLKKIPDIKLIFGHSGIYQIRELIELMKEYPNIYAEISTQPYKNIRMLIDEVGSERLLFGSDYPAFNHALSILSVLKATDDDRERNNIFSNNAKLLLNI